MFTGIVTNVGTVAEVRQLGDRRLRIETRDPLAGLEIGASIACDGVCLTVVAKQDDACTWFDVDASAETLAKTTLGAWEVGQRINLERPLKVGDELGGHIVSGHVDGLAEVVGMTEEGDSTRFTFRVPPALAKFMAPKGSVALNGTSLTVNEVAGKTFGVNIIPHTKAVTTWGDVALGDRVNVEIDTLARYVARLAEATG